MTMIDPDEFFSWFFAILFSTTLAGIVFSIVMALHSDGKSDFCYIRNEPTGYVVVQHVPWQINRTVEIASTFDAAVTVAKAINCEIK